MRSDDVRAWLFANWFFAGSIAGLFLLAISPLLWNSWTPALFVVFLQLPAYTFHQVEEHYRDRFRRYVNERVGGGLDVLTPEAVLITNVAGVWLVDLVALYLAYFLHSGLGLIAIYLAIVNGVVHVAGAVYSRSYNPGLITAALVLLPAGGVGWWVLVHHGQCTASDHALGIGVAIAVHAAILVSVHRRIRRFKALDRVIEAKGA